MKKIFLLIISFIMMFLNCFEENMLSINNEPIKVMAANSNDNPEDAYNFGTLYSYNSESVYGESLSSQFDERWYKFYIAYPGEVDFYFNHDTIITSTSAYWNVFLYKSDATTQYAGQDGYRWSMAGNKNSTHIDSIFIPSGTYYFMIESSTYYSSIAYDFELHFVSSNYCETEANGTPGTADLISTNAEYTSVLPNDEDIDWYKFFLNSDGYISISFKHAIIASTNSYWHFRIFESDATTLVHYENSVFSVSGNSDLSTANIGLPAGTYYLKVTAGDYYHSAEEYRIKINATSSNYYEKEKNDTYYSANNVQINTAYTGTTLYKDVDWFTFSTTSYGYFNFSFSHENIASTSIYWNIYFFLSDGVTNILGENVYYIVAGNSNLNTINIGIASGDYYIKILCGDYSSATPYTFKVNFTASNNYEYEVNNSYSKANNISHFYDEWSGNVNSSKDVDWFRFYVTYRANYTLNFNHLSDGTTNKRWNVYVYKNDGTTLIKSASVTGSLNVSLYLGELAYEYCYVKVSSYSSSSYSGHTYTIEIEDDHICEYNYYTYEDENYHSARCSKCAEEVTFNHVWDEGEVTKNSTHLETGIILYKCTSKGCNATKEEIIDKVSTHNFNEWKEENEWTHTRECECGKIDEENHKWNEGTTILEPTCTENGIKRYVCEYCNADKEVEIAPKHKVVNVEAKDPGCTLDGYTFYSYCELCGESFVDKEVIHSSGHEESDWIIDKEPTCVEDGLKHKECTICGERLYEVAISAKGHKESDWIIDEYAGCEHSGTKHKECEVCGENLENGTFSAVGHNFDIFEYSATCTREGYKHYYCQCGYSYKETTSEPIGHNFSDWKIVRESTCYQEGARERYCLTCGLYESDAIPKASHNEGEWIIEEESSCTKEGTKIKNCETCGTSIGSSTIEKNGHTYSSYIVEPTCYSEGYTVYKCYCGHTYEDSYTSPLVHEFGVWTVTIEATTKDYGEEKRECIHCGFKEVRKIDKKAPVTGIIFGSVGGATAIGGIALFLIRKRKGIL